MKNLGRSLLLATLLGVVVYAALVLRSDVHKLREDLVALEWWTFGGAIALAFTNYLLRFLKWEYYLRRLGIGADGVRPEGATGPFRPLPVGESFAIFLSGFVMSITPGKAGEVFKSALLASARGVPVARSAPIVVADRLTDLLSLIVLVVVGSAWFSGDWRITLGGVAMVGIALAFVAMESVTLKLIDAVERVGPGRKLAPKLREAYTALRLVCTPGALLVTTVLSVFAWALECTALWLILRGLHAPVSLPVAFFSYAIATIAGAVAMLPGGLGGTEFVMRQTLTGAGHVAASAAGAATLLVRFATLWFAVLVGFVALGVFRRRYDRNVAVPPAAAPATAA